MITSQSSVPILGLMSSNSFRGYEGNYDFDNSKLKLFYGNGPGFYENYSIGGIALDELLLGNSKYGFYLETRRDTLDFVYSANF